MTQQWQYQLRLYLTEETSERARRTPTDPALRPLTDILGRHHAVLVNQLDAFIGYVTEAEAQGDTNQSLYRWTKATVDDPVKAAKHRGTFAIRIRDDEVYPRQDADALEAELQPLVGGGIVARMSKHDTNPAKNPQAPAEFRS